MALMALCSLLVFVSDLLLSLSPQVEVLPVHCLHSQSSLVNLFSHTPRSHEQDMENILAGTEYEHLDPRTTLSNKDLVKLLMEYCNKRVDAHKKEVEKKVEEHLNAESKHTNDMLTLIVNGLGQKIENVANTLAKHSTATAEKFEDSDLKQETVWSYQEQLMNNLKLGLQDTLHSVKNDMKFLSAEIHSCQPCISTIHSSNTLRQHIQDKHVVVQPFKCTMCSETFHDADQLNLHVSEHAATQLQPLLLESPHAPCHPADQSTPHRKYPCQENPNMINDHAIIPGLYCNICASTFKSINLLMLHMSSHHSPFTHCHYCEYSCQDMRLLNLHVQESHGLNLVENSMTYTCYKCDKQFPNHKNLAEHITTNHNPQILFPCNLCAESFPVVVDLKTHIERFHSKYVEQIPLLDGQDDDDTLESVRSGDDGTTITQVDGNNTLPNSSSGSILDIDPAIVSVAGTSQNLNRSSSVQDLSFNFDLNAQNQTKRLVENAARSPFKITYNNFRTLNGQFLPTNASIQCNAGVYVTAVKPALEAVHEGWNRDIANTTIRCVKVSNRFDQSDHLVSTQIIFNLQPKNSSASASKPVLHFYHTSNSLQAQGSKLMPEGISSATWIVQFFLEPLANLHISENNGAINNLNRNILNGAARASSSDPKCGQCAGKVKPNTLSVKDQSIDCHKCRKTFHKKCTDRRQMKSNWRRNPWYCQTCILACPITSSSNSQQALSTNFQPSTIEYVARSEANNGDIPAPVVPPSVVPPPDAIESTPDTPSDHNLDADAPEFIPQQHFFQVQTAQRFPNYNTRQRSSNINVDNPDVEFLRTALSSCRSTISQQETELKRLNECLVIRDRRIMQLESQVGAAAETIASSRGGNIPNNSPTNLDDKVNALIMKMEKITLPVPANNIYINSCHPQKPVHSSDTRHTETNFTCNTCHTASNTRNNSGIHTSTTHENEPFQCQLCDKIFQCFDDLNLHRRNEHVSSDEYSCDFCENGFLTRDDLILHIESSHENVSFPCEVCDENFQSSEELNVHIESKHNADTEASQTQNL